MHEYETPLQIAAAINLGDRAAETVLFERYYRTVLYILRKRLRDEESARDLCQETFRVTLERLRRAPLQEPEKLAAFIHSIAVKLSIADIRKAERRQTYPDSEYVDLGKASAVGKLPFFLYPHAEIDGKQQDSFEPEMFSYKITSAVLVGTGAKL